MKTQNLLNINIAVPTIDVFIQDDTNLDSYIYVKTLNEYEFNELRIQIASGNIDWTKYSIKLSNGKYMYINNDGTLDSWRFIPFNIISKQLSTLIGLQAKKRTN